MTMISQPLVSICTHVRNRLSHLKKSLDALLAQDYTNLEIIIVDYDCQEGTYEEIRENYCDPRVKVYKHTDKEKEWSRAVAKNSAVSHAAGDWVLIMDCDNILHPDFISKHVQLLERKKNYFIFGGARTEREQGTIPYGLTLVKREDFLFVEGFNESLIYGWGWEDDDLALRLIDSGVCCLPALGHIEEITHSDALRNSGSLVKDKDVSVKLNELMSHLVFYGLDQRYKVNWDFEEKLNNKFTLQNERIIQFKNLRVLFSNRSMDHAFPFKYIKTYYSCEVEVESPEGVSKVLPVYLVADLSLYYHCYYLFVDRIHDVKIYERGSPESERVFRQNLLRHKEYCLSVTCKATYKLTKQYRREAFDKFLNTAGEKEHKALAKQFTKFAGSNVRTFPLHRRGRIASTIERERRFYNNFRENFSWRQLDYPKHYIYWVVRLYLSGFDLVYKKSQTLWVYR